jgi:hypothetical protein
MLSLCAVLSGADDFEEMQNYGKQKEVFYAPFWNCLMAFLLVSNDNSPFVETITMGKMGKNTTDIF